MVYKKTVIRTLLGERAMLPVHQTAQAFAPTNIALVKYWGKRNRDLNLPVTGSLSVALPTKGAWTTVSVLPNHTPERVTLNGQAMGAETDFFRRVTQFLDLFRHSPSQRYAVDTVMNIPVAAGVASSACGFAALILAINALCDWRLPDQTLSVLARLGSGSACRSLWKGWVEWKPGVLDDGRDSFAAPYTTHADWSDLRIGLLLCNTQPKSCGSREAMQRSVDTSPLYAKWPKQVETDLLALKDALANGHFEALGQIAESNAEAMHACMRAAMPSIDYATSDTSAAKAAVHALRARGIPVFYTQDAGPNLKLLFLAEDADTVKSVFKQIEIEQPFVVDEQRG
jgi:diphosphomevalonate decarboxylase